MTRNTNMVAKKGGATQAPSKPTQYQRAKPNPRREYNNERGKDGMSNSERWERYSKPNFNVVDIDTGKNLRVAAKVPVAYPSSAPKPPMETRSNGPQGVDSDATLGMNRGKAPGRMLQGIQKRNAGEAMGAYRMTRKGLGGINRANNKKLGGI